jgi:hypothetical protein
MMFQIFNTPCIPILGVHFRSHKKYVIQCDPHEQLHNIHGFNMSKLRQIHDSMLVPFALTI